MYEPLTMIVIHYHRQNQQDKQQEALIFTEDYEEFAKEVGTKGELIAGKRHFYIKNIDDEHVKAAIKAIDQSQEKVNSLMY